jgi:hypothetical protein
MRILFCKICETFIFPLVKPLGERIAQILDSPATNQEKLPAEKVKQELVVIKLNNNFNSNQIFLVDRL